MQNRAVQCTIVPPFHYLASPGGGEAVRADRPAAMIPSIRKMPRCDFGLHGTI